MTADLPPQTWDDDRSTDLHRTFLWELVRFTVRPLAGGPAQLIRGVLQPPDRLETTRVVLWDGSETASSTAYDLPLTDRWNNNIPWNDLIASLRHLLNRLDAAGDGAQAPPDGLGTPVTDAREEVLRLVQDQTFDETDALHAAVSLLRPHTQRPDGRVQLSGFLLLDHSTARLYTDEPSLPGRIGLDISLHDDDSHIRVGNTALMAALPSLVPEELEWNRSDTQDPYCTMVYDFTHW